LSTKRGQAHRAAAELFDGSASGRHQLGVVWPLVRNAVFWSPELCCPAPLPALDRPHVSAQWSEPGLSWLSA